MIGLLLAIAIVFACLVLHPFVTYPLSLRLFVGLGLFDRRPLRPVPAGLPQGQVALCVCAYNEEQVIAAKVENMLAAGQAIGGAIGGVDILVYVDGTTDRTAEILREYGDRIRLVLSPARLGKTHGMNTLVDMTSAEFVVFTDANVLFAPDALKPLLAPFADPAIGCVCGHLVYTRSQATGTAATGSLYWRLEEAIKTLESATGSVMGADGSIFALRRAAHEAPPADLIDDMYISLAALCSGYRVVRAADAIAYEDAVSRPAEEFRRKIRIACQAFNVHRALWPRLRRLRPLDLYKYVSHKLLRWLTVFFLALSAFAFCLAIAVAQAWWLLGTLLIAGGLAAVALATAQHGILATIRGVLGAFAATGIGVVRSCRGDRFQTWSPPVSARRLPTESASSATVDS